MFLLGSSGPGVGALVVAAISLGVASLLRTRETPRPAAPAAEPGGVRGSRTVVSFAVAGGVLSGVALVVALVVAQGEARGHAFFHWVFGVMMLALFTAIGFAWHPRADTSASAGRAMLLTGVWLSFAALLLESIGGAGYDKFNADPRIHWLAGIHGLVLPIAGLGLLLLPVSVVLLVVVLVANRSARRRQACS